LLVYFGIGFFQCVSVCRLYKQSIFESMVGESMAYTIKCRSGKN
jgi:hypothetical protein